MTRDRLAEILNRFPEVRWDRCAGPLDDNGEFEYGAAYGWIAREDAHEDFLVIEFQCEDVWFTTSSARYSREFDIRLRGTDEGHCDCERVEHVFGGLVTNKIELPRAA